MNHNKVDSTSVNLNPFGSWKRSNCDVSSVEEFNGPGKNVLMLSIANMGHLHKKFHVIIPSKH